MAARISFTNAAYAFSALTIVVIVYLSGWLFPNLLQARVIKMYDQRALATELAVELADLDFDAGCRRIYQIQLEDRIFPENIPGEWSGKVVSLSKELLTADTTGALMSEFLPEFIENYNARMLYRSGP